MLLFFILAHFVAICVILFVIGVIAMMWIISRIGKNTQIDESEAEHENKYDSSED